MKISLFIFNPYSGIGGGDKTLYRFLNSVNFERYNVTLITLSNIKKFSKKIKIIKLKSSSTFISFFQIQKIIANDNSSKKIFFSMQYFVNVPAILFLRKIKNLKIFIYEINHPDELDYSENIIKYLKKKILKLLIKKIYKKADIIASNSEELSKDLSTLINKQVKTIYNPCFFKINFYKKRKINFNKINILNIARFEHQKDHLTLLRAINFSKVKDKIKLNLIGYGSKEKLIRNYIFKNNINCKIYTKNQKLSSFYKSNDLFVLSSLYEGLPTVMIEAASYCLPIISSKFKSGSREILGNNKFGYLFPIKDYRLLSSLLDNFYENRETFYKKEKLCRKNLEKFSYKKNIRKFNFFLDTLSY